MMYGRYPLNVCIITNKKCAYYRKCEYMSNKDR